MPQHELTVSRRTALKLGAITAFGVRTLVAQTPLIAAAQPQGATMESSADSDVPRFRFDCVTPVPGFSPLHRLEEVWASPRYLTFTDCRVTFVGGGAFHLTPEESAIVRVAEDAGAIVDNRSTMYLLILAATARIDPARFEAKLAELGRPVVEASLALAPQAPQATRFADWLAATA